ncbi:DUF72 domain-containing protein [Pedobacter sp. UC225_61]|uniref:DUF72 domain-containing protein n=1 Tax=Pedobacter sp. UC225_61 TaxID=3374623 RepID=UPI0037B87A25
MEFGRVATTDVKFVDHSLPPDGRITVKTLPGRPAEGGCKFHLGCAKWGRKEWKRTLYPKGTRESDFLQEYARHFDHIELNACFYSLPSPHEMKRWKEQVDASGNTDFTFVPKMSRSISHIKRLVDCKGMVDRFMEAVREFGPSLGPVFLGVSDNFGPKQYGVLKDFLENDLPKDHRFFLEVRHPGWFGDEIDRGLLFDLLAKHQVGTVMSDASGRRDCLHMELPTPELFVRFVGNGGMNRDSDRQRVDEWINRISRLVEQGLEKVYFFVHQHDEDNTPLLAKYTIEQFNQRLGAGLREVQLRSED